MTRANVYADKAQGGVALQNLTRADKTRRDAMRQQIENLPERLKNANMVQNVTDRLNKIDKLHELRQASDRARPSREQSVDAWKALGWEYNPNDHIATLANDLHKHGMTPDDLPKSKTVKMTIKGSDPDTSRAHKMKHWKMNLTYILSIKLGRARMS